MELIAPDSASSNARHAIVIFDTRYGNTEKIARTIEAGLKQVAIHTDCVNVKQASPSSLKEYDLIVLGAPTEWLTASKSMKNFLENLKDIDLTGKFGFAFDTRLSRPMSGSAAKLIEKELKHYGVRLISDRESATVFLQNGSVMGAWLKDGEEKKFEEIGRQIGIALLKAVATEAIEVA